MALVLSDQRMPGMGGVDLLHQARSLHPDLKAVLLTAYADTGVAIQAINTVQLDYYILKPVGSPRRTASYSWPLHTARPVRADDVESLGFGRRIVMRTTGVSAGSRVRPRTRKHRP